jgi:hypothetical protein
MRQHARMPTLLMPLRQVPADELEEVCDLLEAAGHAFYITPPGLFGISPAGLWTAEDAAGAEPIRALLRQYQAERGERMRALHAEARARGEVPGFFASLRRHPLQMLAIALAVAGALVLALAPGWLLAS